MKPEQKFILSCRQTGEAAARLVDWLDHNQALLGAGHGPVREDIECLAAGLPPLAAAAETVPGIGLVATSAGLKTDLLFAILAVHTPTTVGELGQRPMDVAAIRGLLPVGDPSSSCAIVRYSAAEQPPAPRGYPLRIGLLSMTDIVAIIMGACATSGAADAPPASAQDVSQVFSELSSRLSPQALPGLSERDVLDLRNQLNGRWPGNTTLAALSAARYWEHFREIAAHLTERDRRRVLALLWRNDAAYTAVFDRLCDGLDKLGQGADGYCPPEALLGKDKVSGWLTRHPRSIISEATLRTLDQPSGPALAMMNRYGQTVEIERSVVAGLITELPLHLGTSRLNELAPAEILDFPVPPPISSLPVTPASTVANPDEFTIALSHYARTKAVYLFERSCARREVTSLVIVLDPAREDDTYAAAIGDWVETAQGVNAHARERVRRGLFVAAARGSAAIDEQPIQALVRDVIGGGQEWPMAWTPNRPLTDVFWFARPDGTETQPATATQPVVLTPIAAVATTAATARTDTTVQALVQALKLASDPRAKQLQLMQSLQEIRRRLRQNVLRHHASNDPAALSLWRRGTAVVVQDRLQFMIEQGRLGLLHRSLMPSEDDLLIPMRAAEQTAFAKTAATSLADPWRDGAILATPRNSFDTASETSPIHASRMADIAVTHWFACLRRAARSHRLCRDLRVEMGVLHNLVDELQIGAVRCQLASEIASAYTQSAGPPVRDTVKSPSGPMAQRLTSTERDLVRLAAYACRIMTAYLEVLGSVSGRGRNTNGRPARSSSFDLEVADSAAAGYGSQGARPAGGGRRSTRPSQAQWEVSFVSLVEDNIASAHLLAGRGDKDRELGELIQLFASGPFEVEP